MRLLNRLLRPFGVRLVPLRAEVMVAPPWRTHREEVQYASGRWPPRPGPTLRHRPPPPLGTSQETVASAVKPPRATANPDRCDKATGYHSTPHRGCILR